MNICHFSCNHRIRDLATQGFVGKTNISMGNLPISSYFFI